MAAGQFSKNPVVDKALRHSVRDGMAYSVQVGAGETYFSAFALFLRATAPQIALLATLPPLLASGALRVPVAAQYPMAEAGAAYDHFAAGGKLGKIVLVRS